jgi:hypothetical protein
MRFSRAVRADRMARRWLLKGGGDLSWETTLKEERFEDTVKIKLHDIGCDTGERNFPRTVPSGRL